MHQTHGLRTDAHGLTSPLPACPPHPPPPGGEATGSAGGESVREPEGESPRPLDLGLTPWLLPALLLSPPLLALDEVILGLNTAQVVCFQNNK